MTIRIKQRPVGVTATATADGSGSIDARSGASAPLAVTPGRDGFTPLELLDAALAGCLAISARIAARRLGLDARLAEVRVEVRGQKADDPPSRIERQRSVFHLDGDLSEAERALLIREAHTLCTVGISLERGLTVEDAADFP
ncbi:OsmC family protein [Chthonobacter albigriseus]|uniref:OsmC family protein n=1 Tax=Chthonobacter albigriseus TaxID=1683161 RepID=UPI0015EF2009|nr:OsmC family protein [Chthonobacter albigriseus]